MALTIIFDRDLEPQEHARKVVRMLDAQAHKQPLHQMPLIGIARHRAKHPIDCDECGNTYWASDPWAAHARCKGPTTDGLGFRLEGVSFGGRS